MMCVPPCSVTTTEQRGTHIVLDVDPAEVLSGGGLPNDQATQIAGSAADPAGTPAMQASATIAGASAETPIPPPLPIVTAQTLPPQSVAATNDSLPPPPPPAPVPSDASAGAPTTSPAPNSAELDS